MTPACTTWCTK